MTQRPDHYELPLCAIAGTGHFHTHAGQGSRKTCGKEGKKQDGEVEAREKEVMR